MYAARAEGWKNVAGANSTERNTGKAVHYNNNYDYTINLSKYPQKVNQGLSEAARNVAELGEKDRCEHMYLVDLENGQLSYYEGNGLQRGVGFDFWSILEKDRKKKYAFVHNHNTDGYFSETDMTTLLTCDQIPVMIAVRNDSVKYIAERKGDVLRNAWFDDLYQDES